MAYTAYLRWGILTGLCVALFIPFVAPPPLGIQLLGNPFFPFITGKNFAFRIIIELILLAYVILAVREPKYRPKSSLIMWSALALVLWMGLATIFSVDPVKSFWSNFERMEGYVGLLHMFALFVVAGATLTAAKWWNNFFRISIIASALMGFYGVLQLFNPDLISSQSGPRVDTTFGNAAYLAVYMLIHAFLTLFMMIRERGSQIARWLYSTALFLQVLTLFFTETRGAALGLVGGLIIMGAYIAWQAREREWTRLRKIAIGSLAAIVLITGVFIAMRDTELIKNTPMLSRLASISLNDPTSMSRFLYIWPTAVSGSMERPVFGWGQENFSYLFNERYNPAMYAQEQWFDRAHNQFLDWLVAGGVPAFLLYISLFLLAVWAVFRSSELSAPEQGALLGLLAAYGFSNMFVFDNLISAFYFFILLAFVHSLSRRELSKWMFLSKPASDQLVAVVAPIAAIVMLGGAWFLNANGIARAQTLIDAITQVNQTTGGAKSVEENLVSFKAALASGSLGRQEAVEQLLQFAANHVAPEAAIDPEIKQEFYTFARAEGEKMLAERVGDARLELFMAIFLNQFGQHAEALKYLEQASDHSPNKQQILFQIGLTQLQVGNLAEATSVLKRAYDLAPEFSAARVYYAAGLLYSGRTAEADAILMDGFGTTLYDDPLLMQIYTNVRMYDRVIGIWIERVKKDPTNVDTQFGLANAYYTAGDKAGAIRELRKLVEMRPSLASQVETLIEQVQSGTLGQ